MKTDVLGKALPAIFGLFLALLVGFKIIFGGGNALGNLFLYSAIGALLVGAVSPKGGFYIALFCSFYIDFFKRLLVMAGNISGLDVFYVLGIPPLAMMGVCIGILHGFVTGKSTYTRFHYVMFAVVAGLFLARALVMSRAMGVHAGMIAELDRRSTYLTLLFIIPVLFRSREEIEKLFRVVIVLCIPVCLYLIHQAYFGLATWEERYLLTGFSIEARQFNERIFRPFSTMNAAANVSVVLSIMAALILIPWRTGDRWSLAAYFKPGRLVLALFFAFCAWLTLSRGGWVCGGVALVSSVLFRSRLGTVLAYGCGIAAMVTVMVSASWVLQNDKLTEWSSSLAGKDATDRQLMSVRLGTFASRLTSYENLLTKSEYWTPLGIPISHGITVDQFSEKGYYAHDAITNALLTYGYIPLTVGGISLICIVLTIHRGVLSASDPDMKNLMTASLACAIGIAAGLMANGAQLRTYPVNLYFWFFFSVVTTGIYWSRLRARSEAAERTREAERLRLAAPPQYATYY